jgi:beta-lactamase class A
MRKFLLACLMPCFVVAPGSAGAADENDPREVLRQAFERKARELVDSVDGVFGVVIRDLATGETFAVHENLVFTQASAIKVQILVELLKQASAGELQLDEVVTVQREDLVGGAGILRQLSAGKVSMSLRDLAVMMIVLSDNTATNILIDRVGMDRVNQTMQELGFARTRLQRKMMDREAVLEERENLSTPAEAARLLEMLHLREILDEESCEQALQILALPKEGRIGRKLPAGVEVAHKTGSVAGVVNDVGIVRLKSRPFIVSAMINWHLDKEAAEEAIADLSFLAFQYFERLENSTRYGHRK